jgi:Protein of unknown function (DUF2585)
MPGRFGLSHPAITRQLKTVPSRKYFGPIAAVGLILIGTAIELRLQGRLWMCACPKILLTRDAWSSETSQLFLDPYSLTHVAHGLMFAGLLVLLFPNVPPIWRFVMAIAIESVWEIIENTNAVIERYRVATASLGYQGDSIVNSLGDILCCAIGFMIARKLGWRRSIVVFLVIEALLLVWIRDSLLLEIIMLIHPINAIKTWQLGL